MGEGVQLFASHLERFEELTVHGLEADACRAQMRAGIAALKGDREHATALFTEATQKWDELNVMLDGALARAEMAMLLGLDAPATRTALEESREVLERLRASPLLEFLQRVQSGSRRASGNGARRVALSIMDRPVAPPIETHTG